MPLAKQLGFLSFLLCMLGIVNSVFVQSTCVCVWGAPQPSTCLMKLTDLDQHPQSAGVPSVSLSSREPVQGGGEGRRVRNVLSSRLRGAPALPTRAVRWAGRFGRKVGRALWGPYVPHPDRFPLRPGRPNADERDRTPCDINSLSSFEVMA